MDPPAPLKDGLISCFRDDDSGGHDDGGGGDGGDDDDDYRDGYEEGMTRRRVYQYISPAASTKVYKV